MKINKGGKVLSSGGFGCVFEPALKCQGHPNRDINKVSKLMTEKHAMEEYQEINTFKEKLDKIKDYENYFLLFDVTLCKPDKLTSSDLSNYSKKCSALSKINITKSNINDNNNKLMLLNMPNGGLAVDDYIFNNGSYNKIFDLHIHLIDLFKKGIIPMNSKNIFHCDIKDSNVLVDDTSNDLKTRLIDWGLSTTYIPFKNNPFPKTWKNRPLQFNVPFSVIIFTDLFIEKYSKYIEDNRDYKNEDKITQFVLDYVTQWMNERGAGHYKFINEIMYILFSKQLTSISENSKPNIIETDYTMPYIVNYITNVLIKYTRFRNDGKLNLREYLDNVFIKNVDVWGFINVYFPILELLNLNYNNLNNDEMILFGVLKGIFVNLYLTADEPINRDNLMAELKKITNIIYKLGIFNKKKPISSSKSSKISIKNKQTSSMKTRKTNTSFKRKHMKKRFRNPIFLSAKNKK